MLVIDSGAVPGFDSVIGSGVAGVPTVVLGKANGIGLSTACGAIPVPVSTAVCGEPAALSAIETAAFRLPAEAGVNVTVMVQTAPAARDAPQLLVSPKLLEFVPVTKMPVIANAAVPGLESVIGIAVAGVPTSVLGNTCGFGLSTACGCVPVPVTAADCGDPGALSAMEIAAARLPVAAGVNVTVMVQLPAAGTEEPQLLF